MSVGNLRVGCFVFLLILLAGCAANSGSSAVPAYLPDNHKAAFQNYLDQNTFQKVYAVTLDGRGAFYMYCEEISGCEPGLEGRALSQCRKRYGGPCKVFARDDRIVSKFPGTE